MILLTNTSFIPRLHLMFPSSGVLEEVDENDEVWSVQENNALDQLGMVDHRWQVILLPVGNTLSAFYTDMGPVADYMVMVDEVLYPTPPFQQVILGAHSVGESRDMADDGRNDDWAVKMLHEQTMESTIIDDWQQLMETDVKLIRNQSVFGPTGKTQRNGYSRQAARRQEEILSGN